jgi:hypothetical protein
MEGPSTTTNNHSQFVYLTFSVSCPTVYPNSICSSVTLVLPEEENIIYVTLPNKKRDSVSTSRLTFTLINSNWEETSSDKIKVTIGKIKRLRLKLRYFFHPESLTFYEKTLTLGVNEELVPDKTYRLNFISFHELRPSLGRSLGRSFNLAVEQHYALAEMAFKIVAKCATKAGENKDAEARSAS